jgi:nucleotide-binding universal stress UspA family protein
MALKDLIVHLDQSERTAVRLALAVSLARNHGARLVGLFAQRAHAQKVGVVSTWPSEEFTQACDASKATFEAATANLAGAQWRYINRGGEAEVTRHFVDLARHADMVIVGQHEHDNHFAPEELVAEAVVSCGRPVLIVPYIGNYVDVGKTPLIAWNNAPEAARALNDALVLMDGCKLAYVLSASTRLEEGEASCAEVEQHLATHGIAAKTEVVLVQDFGIMDVLLNRTSDRSADLLVMGAQGSIGFPFESRGAGTRHILKHMTVPVLMAS